MNNPFKNTTKEINDQNKESDPINIKNNDQFNINLKDIPRNTPTPQKYQKLRINDWPPRDLIDSAFTCIFCNLQSSPRSTTPIIAKSNFVNRDTGETLTPRRAKKYVEYSCNDCVNGLRSTTSSPRLDLEFAPSSPSFSPRDSSERKSQIVRRRRSITDRGMGDSPIRMLSSPNRSPIRMASAKLSPIRTKSSNHDDALSILRTSPVRSNLRRSKTMEQAQFDKNLALVKEKKNNLSR